MVNKYKFGILYAKGGQNEMEMYSNGIIKYFFEIIKYLVESSESFEEFLEFLGEKIRLKGYIGYSGGLNVESKNFIFFIKGY